ncbi:MULTISPECIES: cytochrome bd-I oxidase subunit CydX [Salinivibrio]|uniref:Cytochrome bd-I oxidase subunit CydX n=1 Tax=Salinivibrio costicola TaxID=51367 RepID=A0ABX6K4C0_SALCS|nr:MULTISPECIES: cytochrome bd-I oxidase subunit CydX [Salinivibrio]PCE67476.1 cytochrome bd-I oxidase subunit CydX [Salinivibrio sp. YCSC6]QCF35620.1 cytochrome bd-I oxidase subunit CydX [Salinivibrio sp. YCSC6]QIR06397.1 cytochrome bd-I oxidase subunit CydX [Salinivibrio costicola]
MWYVCWVLGVFLACTFSIIIGLWTERFSCFE